MKRKSVTCISEIINSDSTENDNLKFEIKNSSKKKSNLFKLLSIILFMNWLRTVTTQFSTYVK